MDELKKGENWRKGYQQGIEETTKDEDFSLGSKHIIHEEEWEVTSVFGEGNKMNVELEKLKESEGVIES